MLVASVANAALQNRRSEPPQVLGAVGRYGRILELRGRRKPIE